MQMIYIPKGEFKSYESIITDNLVVNGHLEVVYGIRARNISGHGVISAGTIDADSIVADEVECSSIICRKLAAKRIEAAEIHASESAVASCFLASSYVEAGKLTVALSEIDEIKAQEVIHLHSKNRGMLRTLFASFLRSLWLRLTIPNEVMDADYEEIPEESEPPAPDAETAEQITKTVREVLEETPDPEASSVDEEDFELKRFIALYKLLRIKGYTLQVVPGAPEKNAHAFLYNDATVPLRDAA